MQFRNGSALYSLARRPPAAAACAAGVLILAGAAFRVWAGRLDGGPRADPLPAGTLASLPREIADWRGVDVPLSDRLRAATDTDDLLSRRYVRGTDSVALYVAYGTRPRDLAPHRPEVCYPGAGWTLLGEERVSVPVPDAADPLECRILRFSKGVLGAQELAVLNFFLVDGVASPDVGLLRRRLRSASHIAQVQIACATSLSCDYATARARILEFAGSSVAAISDALSVPAPEVRP